MKDLYQHIDKTVMPSYPLATFPGRVYEITSKRDADKAIDFLSRQAMLGIDTETRPSFRKGQTNKVALLQLSTPDECFLFHINRIGITPQMVALFENDEVKKIGLSLKDDIHALQGRVQFTPMGFVDLQDLIGELGILDMSLQKLYANLFHERISKREQLSNWEHIPLSRKQSQYAATDAWACLKIYDEYLQLKHTQDFRLITD